MYSNKLVRSSISVFHQKTAIYDIIPNSALSRKQKTSPKELVFLQIFIKDIKKLYR